MSRLLAWLGEEATRRAARRWALPLAMMTAIATIIVTAVWSTTHERQGALVDHSQRQALLATAVGIDFEDRLAAHLDGAHTDDDSSLIDEVLLELLAGSRRLEREGELLVMIARPGQPGFLTTDRRVVPSSRLRAALDGDATSVVLPRDEAPKFGLPRRMAVAGLARVAARGGEPWGVVVIASAERLRDRQRHDTWRLGITVVVATAVVAGLGAVARRRLRSALELERQVAISGALREREAALAKADKMATMAAMSTGIAHELGTPLSIIVGRVEQVLGRVPAGDRSAAALQVVLDQVARIQSIVRGSLALARGDSPHLVPTAPALVARRAAELVRHRFDKAVVELVARIDDQLADVACDPALLEQALVNLLLNACQATPPGARVTLDVRAEGARVLFVVDDEGAGIPDAVAERASEPFFSTKRDAGGSGLGLTIAREIVKHHGGELRVARREGGVGTRAVIAVSS
ncbi:MAG: HAMP domain-containing histidine kinase [Labilithrix sp.]|nr:HAMP domain-containing histidine kinase [Labilithrix sp.]